MCGEIGLEKRTDSRLKKHREEKLEIPGHI
jgi:hypothetical protein